MGAPSLGSLLTDVALPLVYVAALWAIGVIISAAAGARDGVVLAGSGLLVSTALAAVVGVAQAFVWFPFGWGAFLAAGAAAAVLAALGGVTLRRLLPRVVAPVSAWNAQKWTALAWTALGLLVSSTLAFSVVWVAGGRTLETVSQTWDAIFDANAVRFAADSGTIAPTRLTAFAFEEVGQGYYPSTFHTLAMLFMRLAGADAVVATNVVAGLIGGGIWVSAVVLGTRYVLGRSWRITLAAGICSWGFYTGPWGPLGWGVLWATALAASVAPLALAGGAALLGVTPARHDRIAAGAVTAGGLGFLALLHPRVAVIVMVLLGGLAIWVFGARALTAARTGSRTAAVGYAVLVASLGAAFLVVVLFVGRHSESTIARYWPPDRSAATEVRQWLLNGTLDTRPQLITAVLVMLGLVLVLLGRGANRGLRWLGVLYLGAIALDLGTAIFQGVFVVNGLARFWYNDRHRVMALVAFPAILLCVVAVRWLAGWWRQRSWPGLGAVAIVGALVVVANGAYAARGGLAVSYENAANDPRASLVSPQEREFFDEIADVVAPTDRILNNANDGSALLYAYEDRHPLFLVAGNRGSTTYSRALWEGFTDTDPVELCVRLTHDNVRWVLNNGPAYAAGVILPMDAPA